MKLFKNEKEKTTEERIRKARRDTHQAIYIALGKYRYLTCSDYFSICESIFTIEVAYAERKGAARATMIARIAKIFEKRASRRAIFASASACSAAA